MFAALAVSRWIEDTTGWSIKRFVPTTRRYHTIEIQAGAHIITAADPLPDDLREILRTIHGRDGRRRRADRPAGPTLDNKDPRSAVPESLSMRMCFRTYRLRAWLRWAWAMARCVSRMPNMTSLAMICIIAMVSFTTPLMMATTMST